MAYWLAKLDRLPPNVCLLLAREPHRLKSPRAIVDVARHSGLSKKIVRRIGKLRSWASVSIERMEAFKTGCGILPGRECMQVAYLKRTFNSADTPLFHIQRLRRMSKDKRLDKFLQELMKV
jgi:hypothetical protein